MVKNLRVTRVWTAGGENHYVLHHFERNAGRAIVEDFDLTNIRRSMTNGASKPVLLGDE